MKTFLASVGRIILCLLVIAYLAWSIISLCLLNGKVDKLQTFQKTYEQEDKTRKETLNSLLPRVSDLEKETENLEDCIDILTSRINSLDNGGQGGTSNSGSETYTTRTVTTKSGRVWEYIVFDGEEDNNSFGFDLTIDENTFSSLSDDELVIGIYTDMLEICAKYYAPPMTVQMFSIYGANGESLANGAVSIDQLTTETNEFHLTTSCIWAGDYERLNKNATNIECFGEEGEPRSRTVSLD